VEDEMKPLIDQKKNNIFISTQENPLHCATLCGLHVVVELSSLRLRRQFDTVTVQGDMYELHASRRGFDSHDGN
jgi:hypothetical protein